MSTPINDFIFHNNTSSIGVGRELTINAASIVNIEFNVTGTFTAKFEGQVVNKNNWYPVSVINLKTYNFVTETGDATVIYQVPTDGWTKIRINLTNLSGTISVYGNVVS